MLATRGGVAFEELCLPHLDAAYNLARLLVGRDADAQDVVQEAYVRALQGFKGFRGDSARAWLLAIVRNAAYSWLKKHAKQSYMVPFDPAIHARTNGTPLYESSHEERVQQLDEALSRLPVTMREVLVLRELSGQSKLNPSAISANAVSRSAGIGFRMRPEPSARA